MTDDIEIDTVYQGYRYKIYGKENDYTIEIFWCGESPLIGWCSGSLYLAVKKAYSKIDKIQKRNWQD